MSDPANPADAAARFMQDMWKAFTPGAAGSTGAGSGSAPPMPFMPTPEMVRSMQSTFLTAMEEAAERTMRTPQFLDAMRRGMEESLAMQQQLRAFLQQNVEQSMHAAGADTGAATVAALQRIEREHGARLDGGRRAELARDIRELERRWFGPGAEGAAEAASERNGEVRAVVERWAAAARG